MNSRSHKKVAVTGGGIAGLSIAWRLAQSGCQVHLFEQARMPSRLGAATWASAGMICARLEMAHIGGALAHFAAQARAAWPNFAREIEQVSGRSCGFVEKGALQVGFDDGDGTASIAGVAVVDGDEARRLEPGLSRNVRAALWAPDEAHVDPRLTALALEAACRQAGVVLHAATAVTRLVSRAGVVTGVLVGKDSQRFDHVVVAAGAWSGDLLGASGIETPRIEPVKGETVSLMATPADMPVRRIVWTPGAYIAPHADGRIVIGATQTRAGFDMSHDPAEAQRLLDAATRAVPGLAALPELDRTVGFRPASADAAPALGGIGLAGLTLASGQFRNGILFAPLIAHAAATHVLRDALPDIAKPFAASRLILEAS